MEKFSFLFWKPRLSSRSGGSITTPSDLIVLWDINHQPLKFLNQTSEKLLGIDELKKWYKNSRLVKGMEPVSGKYQVQIFAKSNTSYRLTKYSFDTTGTINGIGDKNGTLAAGASTLVEVEHSEGAIPVRRASLNINKASFFDTRYRDMAFISGTIAPADGRSISSIGKYLQIKIGSFTKSIDKRFLKKIKKHGQTTYLYGSFGKNGLFINLNVDTGEFYLFVGNVQLDSGDTTITTDVMIQADDVIAKGLVTFKNIRKNKDHGR